MSSMGKIISNKSLEAQIEVDDIDNNDYNDDNDEDVYDSDDDNNDNDLRMGTGVEVSRSASENCPTATPTRHNTRP